MLILPIYYEAHRSLFYSRKHEQQVSDTVIGPGQIKLLESIRNILKADSSDYRIIINPLYDQLKLNPADFRELENIFGNGKVFDLSGINWFTEDIHHYYEVSDYRPLSLIPSWHSFIRKETYTERNISRGKNHPSLEQFNRSAA